MKKILWTLLSCFWFSSCFKVLKKTASQIIPDRGCSSIANTFTMSYRVFGLIPTAGFLSQHSAVSERVSDGSILSILSKL